MGRLSLIVDWENGPKQGHKPVSFNPYPPVILANSAGPDKTLRFAASDLGMHCLPMSLHYA